MANDSKERECRNQIILNGTRKRSALPKEQEYKGYEYLSLLIINHICTETNVATLKDNVFHYDTDKRGSKNHEVEEVEQLTLAKRAQ